MGPLLGDWIAAYMAGLSADHADRSVDTIAYHLSHFVAWCTERRTRHGAMISSTMVLHYQRHLHHYRDANGKGFSRQTQYNRLGCLRQFGTWCVQEGLITDGDPFAIIQLPKIPRSLPLHRYTPEQVTALLAVPDIHTPVGLRNRCILAIVAAVGLHGRELASLKLADIEAATGMLRMRPATRGRTRTVPIGTDAGAWLRRYLTDARPALLAGRPDTPAVFVSFSGHPMDPGDFCHLAREAAKKAAIPHKRVLAVLKDTLAVNLLENGCDPRFLAALFGHADLQSVRKYERVNVRELQEIHRRYHPAEQPRATARESIGCPPSPQKIE